MPLQCTASRDRNADSGDLIVLNPSGADGPDPGIKAVADERSVVIMGGGTFGWLG